uniref:Uncharacterized protein n=1 Tax=Angiostrongylus cantonensis TaxID=6313 RepID=A0A0K0DKV3_ANGCA
MLLILFSFITIVFFSLIVFFDHIFTIHSLPNGTH